MRAPNTVSGLTGCRFEIILRSAIRDWVSSDDRSDGLGFRVGRTLKLGDFAAVPARCDEFGLTGSPKRDLAKKLTDDQHGRLLLAGSDAFEICHEQLITQWMRRRAKSCSPSPDTGAMSTAPYSAPTAAASSPRRRMGPHGSG
jgi:hypothetical protein